MTIKTKPLDGNVCGTCNHWENKHAISSRLKALIPNSLCECKAKVKIPGSFPASIQKVSTLCEDGLNCPAWEDNEEDFEVIVSL